MFDALTTDRPYRKALAVGDGVQMMRDDAESGWCDPAMLELFIDVLPEGVEANRASAGRGARTGDALALNCAAATGAR